MNSLTQSQYKHFLVTIDNATDEQCGQFTKYLDNSATGYWHWMARVWIIVDVHPTSNAQAWRLKVCGIMPGAFVFVVQFRPQDDWSAWTPNAGIDWLLQYLGATRQI